MIIQSKESNNQPSLIDLLGGGAKTADSKGNGLFSKLLASLGTPAKGNIVQTAPSDFKTLIDPKSGLVVSSEPGEAVHGKTSLGTKSAIEIKTAGIGELRALLKGSAEAEESAFISSELARTLTNDQIRSLIHQAKEYLKNEITAKAPEYQKSPDTLPKSLAGLIQLAQKMGLEPETVTLSTFTVESEQPLEPELLSKPLLETKTLAQLPSTPKGEEASPAATLGQLISELKNKEKKEASPTLPQGSAETAQTAETKPAEQPLKGIMAHAEKPQSTQTPPLPVEEKKTEGSQNAPAQSKNDGLITLLQGESESSALAKNENTNTKIEAEASKTMHAPKADSLEVKSKEAQQSMRHFAADLKEAVENYKPPFTRLTMKLNPEKLGEVEVTLVQRGNNVHVNIQSNNTTTVAFLAHNATELKAQLAHQGITNATMNFMSGGEQQHSQNQQQQPQNRFRVYESFEELELNEEQLGALEIIIPHYA